MWMKTSVACGDEANKLPGTKILITDLDVLGLRIGILLYQLLEVVESSGHLILLQRKLLLLRLLFLHLQL